MKKSLWEETSSKRNIPEKTLPKKTDICIIGGGITGLSTAYFLKETSQNIVLLEKGHILEGVTAKTTAKINFLQADIYHKIARQSGILKAKKYYQSQKDAISLLVHTIQQNQIQCDLEEVSSILFAKEAKNVEKVKKEEALLQKFGEKTKPIKSDKIAYGYSVSNTYTFHPLKYCNQLLNHLSDATSIYENTLVYQVSKIDHGYRIFTNHGNLDASTVVVSCHYPFFIFPMLTPLKTYLKRDYVYTCKIKETPSWTAINVDSDLHSIRFYKNHLIYATKEHLLTDLSTEENAFLHGKKSFQKLFGKKPTDSWINQDVYSHDHLPFIGRVRKNENLFVATAYNAWGMTNGTLAGKIIADLILKNESPYESIFDPTRKSIPLLMSSIIGSVPYIKGYLSPLFSKEVVTKININNVPHFVVLDKDGHKHFIQTKCPHMKCSLLWNKVDETWDCPCHGSRFSRDGKLLMGPSKENIEKDEAT